MWQQAVQQAAYAALQARGRRGLNRGVITLDFGAGGQHLTTVARPHSELARLASTGQRLPASDRHYRYPAGDLHLTVLNLDQNGVEDRLARVRLAREVLAATAPFSVALVGLGISTESVYVQAYDRTGALLALRRRLSRVTGSRPPLALRLLGFVNLLRFRTSEVEQIATAVAALRQLPLGTLEVQTVEIVQTDRVLSQAGTTLLHRVDLRR